jgi:Zn-dependent peptidase ImmA (M78 family)
VVKIPPIANLQNVTGHAKRRHDKQKRTIKRQTKCQPFAKLKELQADTQANAFAAHLILPNRTQSPPTTRQVDG